MAFLEGSPPRVIAHRGLAQAHAENTLGAFGAAISAGADILETDLLHLSRPVRGAGDAEEGFTVMQRLPIHDHRLKQVDLLEWRRVDNDEGAAWPQYSVHLLENTQRLVTR